MESIHILDSNQFLVCTGLDVYLLQSPDSLQNSSDWIDHG